MKKERFQASLEKVSQEELFLKRIQLAEIKENAWRWRGTRTSHKEQLVRLEKGNKEVEKEKVRDKIKRQEEIKEKEEKDIRKTFLDAWK